MLEAPHYTATAEPKGTYALPDEFGETVNQAALYHSVRAFLANQRQGTHSTKTRSEVSGGTHKPWRQKGTGRSRQGTIRAPQWAGGGVAFGPKPRGYRTKLPRRVRRLARQSALNARAGEGAVYVIESLTFEVPKTRQLLDMLERLGLVDKKVLMLTTETRPAVHLSSRNLADVHVMRFADAAAYHLLWADVLVIEEGALGGPGVPAAGESGAGRTAGARKGPPKKPATRAAQRTVKAGTTRKKATKRKATKRQATEKKIAKKKATRRATPKKGSGDV